MNSKLIPRPRTRRERYSFARTFLLRKFWPEALKPGALRINITARKIIEHSAAQ